MRVTLFVGVLLVLGVAAPVAAQSVTPPRESPPSGPFFTIDLSTTPMTRNVVMGETAYAGFARALDWGVDTATRRAIPARSGGAIAMRIGRFAFVDVWVAQYLFAWTHEYGHKTRINEAGAGANVVISGTPWSMTAQTFGGLGLSPTPGIYGAGMEATTVIARRVERRMAFDGSAHYTDLAALFIANGMTFGYIQQNLSAGRVSEGFTLMEPAPADPSGYAVMLAARRLQRSPTLAERQAVAADIRRGSWWNLADYNLVMNVGGGLFHKYLWRGERQTSVRWMRAGSIYFMPGVRYELTPIGPERQVRSFVRTGRTRLLAYVRWSERVDAGRLTGAGTDVMLPRRGRLRPSVAVDVWKNPDGTMASRFETAAEWYGPTDRWRVEGAIGGKTRGYLLGFPDTSGAYVSGGLAVKF